MARAEALHQSFHASGTSSAHTFESIIESLQMVSQELQATCEQLWLRQETLSGQHQQQLKEHQRYREFFRLSSDCAIFTDREGIIYTANQAMDQLLQGAVQELVGQSLLSIIPLGTQSEFHSLLRALPPQNKPQQWDTVLRCPDHTLLPVTVTVQPCRPPCQDELCWFVNPGRDLTSAATPQPAQVYSPGQPASTHQNHLPATETAALAIINQRLQEEIETRKQTEQALQFRAKQDHLLHGIAERIRSSLDLNQVLTATVTEIRQLLQVDRVLVLQFQADGTKLVAAESRHNFYPSLLAQAYQEPCFQGQGIQHYRQGKLRAFEDILAANISLHPCLLKNLKAHSVRALLLVPIVQQDQVWGMLVAHHCRGARPWPDHEQALLTRLATQVSIAIQQSALYDKTLRLSRVDRLTQIANRRWFDDYLIRMWKQHQRDQTPLALLLSDVDYFKAYNDSYGHPAGDCCLRTIAELLDRHVRRPHDLVARYGGEEFAAILPNTNLLGAHHIAENMLKSLRRFGLPHRGSPLEIITMSFGVVSLVPEVNERVEGFIQMADHALYEAKARGRNQICQATPLAHPSISIDVDIPRTF